MNRQEAMAGRGQCGRLARLGGQVLLAQDHLIQVGNLS